MSRGTILVLDDDAATVDFIVEILNDEGYTAIGVQRAAEAIALMISESPNLILTDLLMSDMSGLDIIRAAHQHDPTLPVVIMTASEPRASVLQNEGVAVCLLKPFELNDLLACIAGHIRSPGAPSA